MSEDHSVETPLPAQEMLDALLAEQARCWRAGNRVPAEEFLRRYPDGATDACGAATLVYQEYILRERLGETPDFGDYLLRYAPLAEELQRLRAADQLVLPLLEPEPLANGAVRPFGAYELLKELGRGGMGVVYLARHTALNRLVAVKMLLAGSWASPGELQRFRQEAEAAAKLQHPNIVQIYEVGEQDGRPYLALEYVEGGTLEQHLDGTPQPPDAAARFVATLAHAVQHAHQHDIVHRDLKPANILLVGVRGQGSGVSNHGVSSLTPDPWPLTPIPKIADFGLAKDLDASLGPTSLGAIVGTPSYMAPEQPAGKAKTIGPAADIYSLGAILYELLTGRPPFKGQTVLDTLEQVRRDEAVPPRRLQPKVPRDLETICLKCLQKEPAQRYATAQALAEDLRRFQDRQPITARPVSLAGMAWLWARRKPSKVAFLTALLLLAAVVIVGGVGFALLRADFAQRQAKMALEIEKTTVQAAETRAAAAENLAGEQQRELQMQQLQRIRQDRERVDWQKQAQDLIRQAAGVRKDLYLQSQALAILGGFDTHLAGTITRPNVTSVVFDGTGQRLLLGSWDQEGATLWDGMPADKLSRRPSWRTQDEWLRYSTPNPKPVVGNPFAFRSDGTPLHLEVAKDGASFALWDVAKRQVLRRFSLVAEQETSYQKSGLGVGPASRAGPDQPSAPARLAGPERPSGPARLAGPERSSGPARLAGPTSRGPTTFRTAAPSPDGTLLGVAAALPDGGGSVVVWETCSGKRLGEFSQRATALAFAPDGTLLAAGDENGAVSLWSLPEGQALGVLTGEHTRIHGLAFGRNAHRRTVGQVSKLSAGRVGQVGQVGNLSYKNQPWFLAAASAGGMVTIWDLQTRSVKAYCRGASRDVFAVAFSPDGTLLASAGRGGLRFYDVATGRLLLDALQRNTTTSLAFSPDGRKLAASFLPIYIPESGVDVWELDYGQGLRTLRGLSAALAKVRFSPDGRLAAGLAYDWQIGIWEVNTGRLRHLFDAPQGHIASNAALAFNADGTRFACCAGEGAKLWDAASGAELKAWQLPPGLLDQMGFHRSGKLLLFRSGTQDGLRYPTSDAPAARYPRVCRLRDLLGSEPTKPLAEDDTFNGMAFMTAGAPDGSYFVAQGLHTGPEGRRFSIQTYDGLTGKVLWSRPVVMQNAGGRLLIDPTGTILAYKPDNGGDTQVSLVAVPTGAVLGDCDQAGAVNLLSPGGRFWGLPINVPFPALSLFRHGDKTPFVAFDTRMSFSSEDIQCNAAGTHLAWGSDDGSVTVCELEQVRERLAEMGLGW